MMQFVKSLYSKRINSIIFVGSGFILLFLSFFLPFVKRLDQNSFFITYLYEFSESVFEKGEYAILLLPFLFPYICAVVFAIYFLRELPVISNVLKFFKEIYLNYKKLNLFLYNLLKFDIACKYKKFFCDFLLKFTIFRFLEKIKRNIKLVIKNYNLLFVNILVYFGFYISHTKGFFVTIIGIILLAIMLLSSYYVQRIKNIQSDSKIRVIFLGIYYSMHSFFYFLMIFIMLLASDSINLLIGSYLTLIGSVLIVGGFLTYLFYTKTHDPNTVIPLADKETNNIPHHSSGINSNI
ncbi:MAG: hypothetical protein OEV44_15325 [Spirochaetota bacterium]|nr:hypothetical protein [Spirochaetota bacterium]